MYTSSQSLVGDVSEIEEGQKVPVLYTNCYGLNCNKSFFPCIVTLLAANERFLRLSYMEKSRVLCP